MAQWWERLGRVTMSTLSGAGTGFMMGGPWGALAGAGVGLAGGVTADAALNNAEAAQESQDRMNQELVSIAENEQQRLSDDRQVRDSILRQIGSASNPYAQGNPGQVALLSRTQASIDRNFASAVDDARRSLAKQGALGTPRETSLLRQIGVDRARTKSGAETDLRARTYDQEQAYEQGRFNNQLSALGTFPGSTGAGIFQGQAAQYGDRARDYMGQANQASQSAGQILGGYAQLEALKSRKYGDGGVV